MYMEIKILKACIVEWWLRIVTPDIHWHVLMMNDIVAYVYNNDEGPMKNELPLYKYTTNPI